MIHGPAIEVIRSAAREAVRRHFTSLDAADPVPTALQVRYALKEVEARRVLDGGASDYITREAETRGVTAAEMAQMIVDKARASEDLEIARVQANLAIDSAADEVDVHNVLEPWGITFSVNV